MKTNLASAVNGMKEYVGSGTRSADCIKVYVWAGIGAEDNVIEVAQKTVIVNM